MGVRLFQTMAKVVFGVVLSKSWGKRSAPLVDGESRQSIVTEFLGMRQRPRKLSKYSNLIINGL